MKNFKRRKFSVGNFMSAPNMYFLLAYAIG